MIETLTTPGFAPSWYHRVASLWYHSAAESFSVNKPSYVAEWPNAALGAYQSGVRQSSGSSSHSIPYAQEFLNANPNSLCEEWSNSENTSSVMGVSPSPSLHNEEKHITWGQKTKSNLSLNACLVSMGLDIPIIWDKTAVQTE